LPASAYSQMLLKELEGVAVTGAAVVRYYSQGILEDDDLAEFWWYMTGVQKGLWKTTPHH